ncbi:MAG: hypothetical protein E7530_00055 [Ruminococcaceae bacterium]|nr:hypothetical protein [Oscillospiraceae bacterium]
MKTLNKYKILQMLMGVFLGCLVLSVVLLLTSIATWEQLPAGNLLSKIILIVIPVMLTAWMSFIAVASKSNGLKFLYYPAFIINMGSLVSAVFYYIIEDSVFRLLFAFTKTPGLPFHNFATAVSEKFTYTITYEDWTDTFTYFDRFNVLMVFLLCLFVSLVVYQLYRDNDEHRERLLRWRLPTPARAIAISSICFYGTYILVAMLPNIVGPIIDSLSSVTIYDALSNVWSYVVVLFFECGYVFFLSGMIIILPIGITIALSALCIHKADKTSNLRYVFNPLVILAIVLSIFGSYMMYTFTMSGF